MGFNSVFKGLMLSLVPACDVSVDEPSSPIAEDYSVGDTCSDHACLTVLTWCLSFFFSCIKNRTTQCT